MKPHFSFIPLTLVLLARRKTHSKTSPMGSKIEPHSGVIPKWFLMAVLCPWEQSARADHLKL